MTPNNHLTNSSWKQSLRAMAHPRVITMLLLGVSAGIPLLLIFSSLSLWLREAGVDRSAVTYFSWAALGYSFKFVWAPLVNSLEIPLFTKKLGRRRSWLLLAQLMIMLAISLMALVDPATDQLTAMALAAVLLGFSAATQDIVIDAYRIESADQQYQALMSSGYIAGYRIGMLIAGAGALYLASFLGSTGDQYNYQAWQTTYLFMALTMLVGVFTTLCISEPNIEQRGGSLSSSDNSLRFFILFTLAVAGFIGCYFFSAQLAMHTKEQLGQLLSNGYLASTVVELLRLILATTIAIFIAKLLIMFGMVEQRQVNQAYVTPVKEFFDRYGLSLALTMLALIGLYRVSDIVLGVISNVFYQDLGFSKNTIASVVKSFGLGMSIVGGFVGGILALRYGIMRILFAGAVLSALTNILFIVLAKAGQDIGLLYWVIAADNLSAGLASAAFVAFLSSLTNISFTAMQYAIFSSIMTLFPKVLGGYSGSIVEGIGYESFFLITALIGLPVLFLIVWVNHLLGPKKLAFKQ
ncbi:MFS transporter [Porticoccaceae bacterium]|jgi:MFS transporter, PAT family, beta-lactamase induction signal transducer AmpG|nr:MFS transporter [Porticoccaceae bacterium]